MKLEMSLSQETQMLWVYISLKIYVLCEPRNTIPCVRNHTEVKAYASNGSTFKIEFSNFTMMI
jgi:hypothetical protein